VLYRDGDISGLATYFLTEEGFSEGSVLENLPGRPVLLAAGDFTEVPDQELALGGGDGRVRIIAVTGDELKTILTTSVLGSAVSALAPVSRGFSLAAGTPGGYVFIFGFPVRQEPDRAVHNGEPVYSLADVGSGKLALGTVRGVLQVISVDNVAAGVAYTVRPSDTLWLIAGRFGTTAVKIMQENNIREPGLIYPGQVLTIPPS
jgi:LysM repeat protein